MTKLLNELHPHQREDAVNSLAYEADMRLRDPVYGCVGVISLLQHQLRQLQMDLTCAKSELSRYQTLGGITSHAHGLLQPPQGGGGRMNLIGAARDHHFFPRDHHHQGSMNMIRSFDHGGGNNYDAALLSMNVSASIGQLSQFQHPRAAAGDDRRTIDPS